MIESNVEVNVVGVVGVLVVVGVVDEEVQIHVILRVFVVVKHQPFSMVLISQQAVLYILKRYHTTVVATTTHFSFILFKGQSATTLNFFPPISLTQSAHL